MNKTDEVVQPILKEVKNAPVKLVKAELLKDKESGLTVVEQSQKYGLPVSQMRKALKIAGITERAKPKVKFTISEDYIIIKQTKLNYA